MTVDNGYFSVLLGEGASTATGEPQGNLSEVFHGSGISDRFIGITVEGLGGAGVDVEIAPRLRFAASPFAFTATQATKLTDSAGNSNFIKVGPLWVLDPPRRWPCQRLGVPPFQVK